MLSLALLSSLVLSGVQGLPSFNRSDPSVDAVAATWYAGWHAEYFPVANLTWDKYTHVTYSFAETTSSVHNLSLAGSDPDVLPQFVKAAHDNEVKALVSIGGWTGGRWFSSYVASAENRTAFVKTVTDLATQYELDGIDFDWEYPGVQGIGCNVVSPNDTANLLAFLQELRADPKGEKLILTAATPVSAWPDANGDPFNLTGFSEVLDYVAIMNYDLWGAGYSPAVGPNAPLNDSCAPTQYQQGSAVSAIKSWTDAGMPVYQIVLGVPGYGHSFSVNTTSAFGGSDNKTLALFPQYMPGQPQGDAWDDQPGTDECGNPTGYGGLWDFWALVEGGLISSNGTPSSSPEISFVRDDCSETPFLYNSTSQIMISYDDAESFTAKGEFIKNFGLRGFAMWEAAGDYKDTLLDAIRSGVGFDAEQNQC